MKRNKNQRATSGCNLPWFFQSLPLKHVESVALFQRVGCVWNIWVLIDYLCIWWSGIKKPGNLLFNYLTPVNRHYRLIKTCCSMRPEREVLPIMAITGTRLRPKRVPFSGFRRKKGQGFHQLKYKKGKSLIVGCERTSDLRANRCLLWLCKRQENFLVQCELCIYSS